MRIGAPSLRAVDRDRAHLAQARPTVEEGDDRRPITPTKKRVDARKAFGLELAQELHECGAPKIWRDAIAQIVVTDEQRRGRLRAWRSGRCGGAGDCGTSNQADVGARSSARETGLVSRA